MSEQKFPMKDMTVHELRIVLQNYKQLHCPPMPSKKSDLVAICTKLNLPTKKQNIPLTDPAHKPLIPIISDFTKKKLIDKITTINGRPKEFYTKWSKKDLTNRLRSLIEEQKS